MGEGKAAAENAYYIWKNSVEWCYTETTCVNLYSYSVQVYVNKCKWLSRSKNLCSLLVGHRGDIVKWETLAENCDLSANISTLKAACSPQTTGASRSLLPAFTRNKRVVGCQVNKYCFDGVQTGRKPDWCTEVVLNHGRINKVRSHPWTPV